MLINYHVFVKHFGIFHNWVVDKKSIQKTKLQPFMVDIVGEIMYVNIVQWKLIDFA